MKTAKIALGVENQRLKTHLAFLENLINQAPVYLYIYEVDTSKDPPVTQIIWMNDQTLGLLEYLEEISSEQEKTNFMDILHLFDMGHSEISSNSPKVPDCGRTFIKPFPVKNKQPNYLWIAGQTYVWKRKPDGTPFQFLNVAFKLPDQEQAEKELCEALKAMKRLHHHLIIEKITKREREILKLVVEGLTDKEIACRLFISERTAQTHRNNLIRKTGCRNTAMLVVFALQCGLD